MIKNSILLSSHGEIMMVPSVPFRKLTFYILVLAKKPSGSHLASSTELENLVPFSQRVNSFKAIHGFVRAEESRKALHMFQVKRGRSFPVFKCFLPLPSPIKGSSTMGL